MGKKKSSKDKPLIGNDMRPFFDRLKKKGYKIWAIGPYREDRYEVKRSKCPWSDDDKHYLYYTLVKHANTQKLTHEMHKSSGLEVVWIEPRNPNKELPIHPKSPPGTPVTDLIKMMKK